MVLERHILHEGEFAPFPYRKRGQTAISRYFIDLVVLDDEGTEEGVETKCPFTLLTDVDTVCDKGQVRRRTFCGVIIARLVCSLVRTPVIWIAAKQKKKEDIYNMPGYWCISFFMHSP
mgnify:CR=1 FL=1